MEDRTFKLPSGTTSGCGCYVESQRGARDGQQHPVIPLSPRRGSAFESQIDGLMLPTPFNSTQRSSHAR